MLYLTHHLPWPAHSGGRLRESQLIGRLVDRFDIHVVAVTKVIDHDWHALSQATLRGVVACLYPATTVLGLCGPHTRRHGSAQARLYLRCHSAQYDVIHVEGHYLMPLLPRTVRRRAVLVEHNVESSLFVQSARLRRRIRDRFVLRTQAALTHLDECRAWRSARVVVGLTDEDVQVIAANVRHGRVRLVPNGADHLSCVSPETGKPPDSTESTTPFLASDLIFVGNFAYCPNADAARELIECILPRVRELAGAVSLTLVGVGPPPWLHEASEANNAIKVTGSVRDVVPWLEAATVVVAPLRMGGGVKVKLLEALAMGKAVVTTRVGAQGLPPGSVVQADNHTDFATAVVHLLTSEPARRRQEARARNAAGRLPSWDLAAESLAACWNLA